MKRLFIFLSALFALFLLQVAPAQAISLGSKTASAKGPDTLLIIQLDPNYVGKPGEIEKRIFDSFADEVKKAGHTVVPFAQAQKDLRIYPGFPRYVTSHLTAFPQLSIFRSSQQRYNP